MIRHVVVMKFGPDCTAQQHEHMLGMLKGLEDEVPEVRALSVGAHVLGDSATPDVALVVDVADRSDLAAYMTNPYHLSVGAYFGGIKDSASIVDFELA